LVSTDSLAYDCETTRVADYLNWDI